MAKQLKRTTVAVEQKEFSRYKGDVLVLGVFKDTKRLSADYAKVDSAAAGGVRNLLKLGDFKGELNKTAVLYTQGGAGFKRIMLIGLGEKGNFDLNNLRQAAGTAVRQAQKLDACRVGLAMHGPIGAKYRPELLAKAITEGAIVGRYDYQDYLPPKNSDDGDVALMKLSIIEPKSQVAIELNRGRKVGVAQGQGMIANKPGNQISPAGLAKEAGKLARQFGLKCKVFNEQRLADMGMNAILAVGQGSVNKPRLIMLEHKGRKGTSARPDLVVVGKAITFDTGGISLKPSLDMEMMKFDKAGGCSTIAILTAVSQLKLPVNVVGLIPSAENMPGGGSYRPGDIIRTYSGKTVEVQNTDAEGRLILCDAMAYAAKMKPKAIVDLATLTGAIIIALGNHYAGLFGNNDDLLAKMKKAAQASGEPVWQMPCGKQFLEQMHSKIADLKNIGGRGGGSCTAAAFLGEFVGKTPWVHIDIASVADTKKEKSYLSSGATGYAVRLILEYLRGE